MDDGPTTCAIIEIKSAHEVELFNESHLEQAEQMLSLLFEFAAKFKHAKGARSLFTTVSVTRWIFATNKIEQSGLSESDTQAVVEGKAALISPSQGKSEVLNTFELLKKEYNQDGTLPERLFDEFSLCNWHKELFKEVLDPIDCGMFRKKMADASGIVTQFYLHHSLVPETVKKLCRTVSALSKTVNPANQLDKTKIAGVFGLAAFSQFHFVDIHPFIDGNGRMCRYLSKRIIDEVCQVPFPMFDNRELYIESLIEGRKLTPGTTHHPLLSLLFDSAIKWYSSMLRLPFSDIPETFIVSTLTDLHTRLNAFSPVDQAFVRAQFKTVEYETLKRLTLPQSGLEIGIWRPMTQEEFDQHFDNL
ncbi:MAG: Fic family protein [archaeon]|nr:Fic family protein [archaeon]